MINFLPKDQSIRAAAQTNDLKENETKENLKKLLDSHDQLNQSYKSLLVDHENLQKIYLQLESDYEEIYSELSKKHSIISSLQSNLHDTNDKLKMYTDKKFSEKASSTDDLIDMQKQGLEFEINKLNQEISALNQNAKYSEQQLDNVRKNMDSANSENATLRTDLAKQKDQNNKLEIQLDQMSDKVRVYESLKDKLEEEKTQLFEQLHFLVQQNQELLVQLLNSKDMFHEETKAYLQQLNNVKRQKEILEQKIMEQYKSCPSQKQKTAKKCSNTNSPGLMDMFSKTRQFVQKVRNKSNLDTSNVIDLGDDLDRQSFCHKYSADDVNYLNIKPKEAPVLKCLSSSSSSSSTSSNYDKPIEVKTPVKIDPKSLKLGRRPQSICSSNCSSPVSQTQSVINSPSIVTIKPPDYKRNLLTSSPKYPANQSPSSSSTSSCSSNSSQKLVKSPIAVITKKPNSIQLVQNGRTKLTSKIADSLKQFRLSAELDQIETCQIRDDDEDEEENLFSDEEFGKNEMGKKKMDGPAKASEIWLEYGCI
ncbi:girdin-like isoform X2 [Brachionus plicatilis]|uniref:Girdin-like isoform X2 n=1 Tax=Brachionus plicatilis TaxID=10195 RepID=A0A3M7T9D0_BRAPC|nr:girdin-like isoform X2 [Brachionus plicatilis]